MNMKRTIGVIAPSLPSEGIRRERVERAIGYLESLGNRVIVSPHVFEKASYKSASASKRAAEFCALIANPEVDVVMCTTGGYNSNEMLAFLDWELLARGRATVVGYSDVTALLLALFKRTQLPVVQGAMLVDWVQYPGAFSDLWRVLDGTPYRLGVPEALWESADKEKFTPPGIQLIPALGRGISREKAAGQVIAANLSTLNLMLGTPYFPDLKGRVLLLEYDKEENFCLPSLERMLWQLRLAGALEGLAALLFGVLQPAVAAEEVQQERTIQDLLGEVAAGASYPVFYNVPFGHMYPSWQVQQGCWCEIDCEGLVVCG